MDPGDLEFEWDEDKARTNLEKHGVDFRRAAQIFKNATIERVDDSEDYGEVRLIALGLSESSVYRVVFTVRDENVLRIISAQKASRNEREIYYRAIHT